MIWLSQLSRMNSLLFYFVSLKIIAFWREFRGSENNNWIVIAAKQQCIQCENIETKLFNLRDDFEQILQAKLVKVVNSQLLRLYTTASEPAIVFFRKGVPLLYDGPFESEEIFMRFNDNRAPAVQELTDEIFEHLTQASTGATTGDWLILL